MSKQKAEKAVETLTDFVNSATQQDVEHFVNTLMREHRSLQQDTCVLFIQAMKGWSAQAQTGNYDERNMRAVMTSQFIVNALNNWKG